jgi:hypothetical protein
MRAALLVSLMLCLAPSWRQIAETPTDRFLVNDARTESDEDGRRVRVWEKRVFKLDTPEGKEEQEEEAAYLRSKGVKAKDAEHYTYSTQFREYLCKEGRVHWLAFYYNRDDGKIISEKSKDELADSWQSPAPESANEELMLDACKKPVELQ